MAWIDNRIWVHPKFVNLTDSAFAAYVKGVALSSGMATGGHLEAGHLKMIGATKKTRNELIDAALWDENGDGSAVQIHDWDDHNGVRDAKREKERERLRDYRRKQHQK